MTATLHHPPDVEQAEAWRATCGPCALAAALGCSLADVRAAVSDPAEGLPGIDEPTFRGYMTIGQMKTALTRMRAHLVREWATISLAGARVVLESPAFAGGPMLACLQWCGPWDLKPRVAAMHRHWVTLRLVAVPGDRDLWVYDWNAAHRLSPTAWVPTLTACAWCDATIEARVGDRQQRCPRCAVSGLGKAPEDRLPKPWPPLAAGGWLRWSTWEEKLLPNLLPERGDGTFRIQWAGAVRRWSSSSPSP